jgi:two-component system, NarL family, response regulator NreC
MKTAVSSTQVLPFRMKNIRILIADDHDIVRAGVRLLIEKQPGWEVCGEAADGREAVALAEKFQPDVAVLDITMPELNGLEAARQIKRRVPQVEVVMLTAHDNESLVHQVFEVGARSYIVKTEAAKHLVPAVRLACAHKPFFTSKVSEIVFARYLNRGDGDPKNGSLTPRERELLQLLAEGKSNKEAAGMLGISIKTVESHRAAVMHKLTLKSVSDLVRYAIRNKIIEP